MSANFRLYNFLIHKFTYDLINW